MIIGSVQLLFFQRCKERFHGSIVMRPAAGRKGLGDLADLQKLLKGMRSILRSSIAMETKWSSRSPGLIGKLKGARNKLGTVL